MTLRLKVTLLMLAAISVVARSTGLYRDALTSFADVSRFATDSTITISNATNRPIVEVLPLHNRAVEFAYYLRIRDNQTEKSSWVKRNTAGSTFGLVWNYRDSAGYCYATLQRSMRSDDDVVPGHIHTLRLGKRVNGRDSLISSTEIPDDKINCAAYGYNTIGLVYKNGRLEIVTGHNELSTIAVTTEMLPTVGTSTGYIVAGKSAVEIKSLEYTITSVGSNAIVSGLDERSLPLALSHDRDPLTGYWVYLDRKTDDKHFTLGGKYRIAIVKASEATYSIIYLSGADLYPERWAPYTIKGRLTTTPFIGNYDLEWTDAQGNIISDETFATIENGILTLHFPLYGSTVRFYKSANQR